MMSAPCLPEHITHRARCFLAANADSPVVYFSAELIGGGASIRLADGTFFRLTRTDREDVGDRINFIALEAAA